MSAKKSSWGRFNRDAKETIGSGLIPFAILAQCFQRGLGWKCLGVLLTIPMALIGFVTLAITALLAAAQAVFFCLVRFPSSFFQDLLSSSKLQDLEGSLNDPGYSAVSDNVQKELLYSEKTELEDEKTAAQWSWHHFKVDIGETLIAGWKTPFSILIPFFEDESIAQNFLGVVTAIPVLPITLASGLISLASVVGQSLFFPLRIFCAAIQDGLSPSLDVDLINKETLTDNAEVLLDIKPTTKLYTLPPRERQFEYVNEGPTKLTF